MRFLGKLGTVEEGDMVRVRGDAVLVEGYNLGEDTDVRSDKL